MGPAGRRIRLSDEPDRGQPVMLTEFGGIQFTEGERYLVSASDGTVSTCGFSGPYTDEMAAAFDEAFGG
jgi:hypothetical protein